MVDVFDRVGETLSSAKDAAIRTGRAAVGTANAVAKGVSGEAKAAIIKAMDITPEVSNRIEKTLDGLPKTEELLGALGKKYVLALGNNDTAKIARYNPTLRAIGDRLEGPNGDQLLKNLEKALSEKPHLSKKIEGLSEANPAIAQNAIRNWNDGNPSTLDSLLTISPRQAVVAKATANDGKTPAQGAPTNAPTDGKGGRPKGGLDTNRIRAAIEEGERGQSTAPVAVAATSTSQAASPNPPSEAPAEPASQTADTKTLTADEVRFVFRGADNRFGEGEARKALKEEFPELGGKIDSFSNYIATHPQAAENMAWLFNENPKLMEMLSGTDNGKPMDPKFKQQVKDLMAKGPLAEMLDNPQKLEDKKFVESIDGTIKSGMAMKGMMDWVKNTIGIDLGKMGGELLESFGPLLNGLMSFLGGFFKGFQGDGNFLGQSAGPQQGGNMFTNFMKRVGAAADDATFQAGVDARDRGFSALDVGSKGKGLGSDGTVLYESGPRRGEPIKFSQKEGGFEVVQNRQGQWVEAVNGEPKEGGQTLDKEAAKKVSTHYDAAWDDRVSLVGADGKEVGKFFVAGDRAGASSMGTPVYRQVTADGKVGDAYYLNKEGNTYQFRTADGKPFGDAAERELRERVFGRPPSSAPGMDMANAPPVGV